MKILLTILGTLLIVISAILLIVSPFFGIIGIALGVFVLIFGRINTREKSVETESADIQQILSKYPTKKNTSQRAVTSDIGERHRVAGTSYHQKEIESLGYPNDEYAYTKRELLDFGLVDERVYKTSFSPESVELIEEPANSEYPGAVRVEIDGVLVGYIKKGSAAHVRNLLHSDSIKRVTAEIAGGKYKILESEYDDEKERDVYTLVTDETNYYITIQIITK